MKRGLGRGLEALLPKYGERKQDAVLTVPIDSIKPNKQQARKKFDEKKLCELAESIKHHNLAQPLVVSPATVPGEYNLIAGERRLRAAKIAGLKEVPVIVKTVTEKEKFLLSLVENIQREDLNPIEEATAYKQIMNEFNFTQDELSKIIGKDRSVVANTIRLLTLPEELKSYIEDGIISAGHGRMLASISDEQKQKELLKKIIDEQLTVREVEHIVSELKKSGKAPTAKKHKKNYELEQLANSLQQTVGTKIKLRGTQKKGRIIIYYYSLAELDRIARILRGRGK